MTGNGQRVAHEIETPMDLPRIEAAVREILLAIGEDPDRDGLRNTPNRVARMYAEVFSGLHEDPTEHLTVTFEAEHDEMVMVRDIPLQSVCEHHLIPFIGHGARRVHPGRRRSDHRAVEARPAGRGAQPQAAGAGEAHGADRGRDRAHAGARGVMVVIEAEHLCMSMRGVKKAGSTTVTSAVRGLFRTNVATREEAMRFVNR